jgi:hypothetical protein
MKNNLHFRKFFASNENKKSPAANAAGKNGLPTKA